MTTRSNPVPRELAAPSKEFLTASESLGLYWWHWDHQERKIDLSPAMIKILGHDPEKFDRSITSLNKNIHPDDVQKNADKIRQLIRSEIDLYEIEYRVKDKAGEWQWYYNRGTVVQRDKTGKPAALGGISIDISSQFRYLLSMVQEKDKFEYIFRNTNEAIIIIELLEGKAGKVLDANKAALTLFNREQEDLMKPLSDEILQDKVIGKDGVLMNDVFEKGFARVERKLKIGNETKWLEISVHAFTLTGENLMIAIAKDKTPQRETEAALQESERMYRTLFESADDPIGLFAADRKIILINSAFHKTFGYALEEFMALEWMEIVHPEDILRIDQLAGTLLQDGFLSIDYRVKHKAGHYLFVSSKNVLIPGVEEGKELILTIIHDITERRNAMEELEQAKKRAEESDRLKSAFLANMSHEIRTPMNSIIGFSNLLANPEMKDETRQMYVQRIVKNSELLLALISDVIDLAKIESGQLSIIFGRIRLSELISALKQYALDELDRLDIQSIEIITEEVNGDFELETDAIRLEQVMKNLINNAIKFTEIGSVKIGYKKSGNDQNIILFVQDTGIGIASEHFGLIFDQFRQIDGSNTRKFGGTGLGLTISKNLTQMMGGKIWAESEAGAGALFQVELPLKSSLSSESDMDHPSEQNTISGQHEQLWVLVVEDEPDSLDLIREMLDSMGHHVITADTGFTALKMLEQSPLPDLVFMDVQMPVLSGTDTLKLIRDRYQGIMVVAQSAHALVGDRERFMDEGYDEYLPKPFTVEQLTGIISTLFKDS